MRPRGIIGLRRGIARLFAVLFLSGCGPDYETIIRNAEIHDGTGAPPITADVAIAEGFIVRIDGLAGATARIELDATGLILAPGFIDVHSHAAGGLATPELAAGEPLLRQGITTIFANPDGGGPIDLVAQRDALDAVGPGVNVAQLIPHGSVRREVMGMANRHANHGEILEMERLVQAGMDAGAFGLSSGLFYTPGSFAALSEVVSLAKVVGDRGVYTSHIRDESDYSIGLLAAIDEVIQVARGAGTRGIVTHIKALGPHVWGYSGQAIAQIEAARAEGVDVWADQYPYEASATSLTALVSRPLLAGDSLRIRLAEQRDLLYADITENLERRGGADRIQFRRFVPDPSIEGATLAEVAGQRALDPVETTMELLATGNAGIVSHNMAASDVEAFMSRPWVMTSSDGGLVALGEGVPHPRNYGSFPRKLAVYVRERGIMDLPLAIRSMTGLPADVMNLTSRGYVREGLVADLVLFDPALITDVATYTQPHQLSRGISWVWVNGEAAISAGELAERRSGRVLRRGED